MKNKIIKFIKGNWYFIFLIIPFISFCIANRTPDNDIWFLLNNGRYVLNHGIPHVDPFTIHEGLHYVMQQWLSSVIFYSIYKTFGKYGILALMIILFWLITYIYYKLCYLISKDKKTSVFIVTIILLLSYSFIVSRPQVFTYIILLLETYFLELYIKNNNYKYLIPLPILSMLLVNLHCSMWFLQFVFLLPFIVNGINIKGITIKKIKLKPILIVALIMFLAGFINPYGYEAITFIFKSYGIEEINKSIIEMSPASVDYYFWNFCLYGMFLLILVLNYNKKVKLDIRFMLFIIGTFLLAAMHRKCIIYFLFWLGYTASNIKFKINIKNKYVIRLINVTMITASAALLIIVIPTTTLLVKNYEMDIVDIDPIVKYITKNYDKDKVILYTDFNQGGYVEYHGLKTYIDPRAEVFVKKFNGKEDIFAESRKMFNYSDGFDFDKFVEKYNFTHLIVNMNNGLYIALENSDNYILEYAKYFDDEEQFALNKLFVRKDVSIKEEKHEKVSNKK